MRGLDSTAQAASSEAGRRLSLNGPGRGRDVRTRRSSAPSATRTLAFGLRVPKGSNSDLNDLPDWSWWLVRRILGPRAFRAVQAQTVRR
jgi:hypothetical protein